MPEDVRRLRLLVVDDEPAVANTLGYILRHHGFEAHIAYSGEEAIEAAGLVSPDVLITDLSMGVLSGIDAAIRIREKLPHCKVIVFSGHFTIEEVRRRRSQADLQDFQLLAKPVHPQKILDLLSESDYWMS